MSETQLEQEPTTKNDLEVDTISRQEAIDTIRQLYLDLASQKAVIDILKVLPSVTPQEPKIGHWIEEFNDLEGEVRFTCSSCGKYQLFGTDFCYNCGSDNREVEE